MRVWGKKKRTRDGKRRGGCGCIRGRWADDEQSNRWDQCCPVQCNVVQCNVQLSFRCCSVGGQRDP